MGDLETIKHLVEKQNKKIMHNDVYDAAYNGHFEIVRYFIDERNVTISNDLFNKAMQGGNLDCVKFAASNLKMYQIDEAILLTAMVFEICFCNIYI